MKDSWDETGDTRLKQAAAAYHSIQAPPDLRERVLLGVEKTESDVTSAEKITGTAGFLRRKICRLGTLAACAAVLLITVHFGFMENAFLNMMPENGQEDPPAVDVSLPDDVTDGGEAIEKEENSQSPADKQEVAHSTESVQKHSEAQEKTSEPSAHRQKSAAVVVKDTPAPVPQTVNDQTELQDGEDIAYVNLNDAEEPVEIPAGKLLPGVMAAADTFRGWKVRVVDVADGNCTVESSNEEQVTTMRLSRTEDGSEDGQWEIQSAENTM